MWPNQNTAAARRIRHLAGICPSQFVNSRCDAGLNEYSDEDESSLRRLRLPYKEFASGSGRANDRYPPLWKGSNMNESVSEQLLNPKVAAFVGIDWGRSET